MVVGVRDHDREDPSSPQISQVLCRSRAVSLNSIRDFKVTSCLMIRCSQHTHGREKWLSCCSLPVKTSKKKNRGSGTISIRPISVVIPAGEANRNATASQSTVLI